MQSQVVVWITLLITGWLCLTIPHAYANAPAEAVEASEKPHKYQDIALEKQLDHYLTLQVSDAAAAKVLLEQLVKSLDENTPIESKVRTLSYYVAYYMHKGEIALTDSALDTLEQLTTHPLTPNARAEIFSTRIDVLTFRNELNQAYIHADSLIEMLPELSDTRIIYWVNAILGRLFRDTQEFDKALFHYNAALDTLDGSNDNRVLIRRVFLTRQTAYVHIDLKNWERAKALLEELITELKHHQQDALLPDVYLTLGFVYSSLKDFSAAEQVNLAGLAGARQFNKHALLLKFMNNLGSDYIDQNKLDAAKTILEQALAEAQLTNEIDTTNFIEFNLAYLQVLAGNSQQGFAKMQEIFDYAKKRNNKAILEEYTLSFTKAYKAVNDYKNLAIMLEQLMQIRSEIMIAEREQNIRNLQDRYDLKTQNQRITILQQQNALQEELLTNKQLQQTITLLFIFIMGLAALLLVNLYRKVQRSNRRLKEVNKQLEYQSLRDPLTGLFNRRAMQDKMAKRHKSSQPDACALLLLDIDFFKQINDNYGHAAGDAVLIDLSRRLLALTDENELLIRWGGEEFLIVIQRLEQEDIDQLCQQVLQVVSALPVVYEGNEIPVTISGGFIRLPFSQVPEHQFNWERVLQVADMALYLSKLNGRNQINLIDELKVPFADAEPHLQSDLNGAIQEDMIKLHTIHG
ncbi:GGDEF domain-containing protein [Rheinheimera sp. UJ51]|uniref:tetratricopeptide repeat-containing diguanylate cyclase n=1 Tax=Rheinheimera sp. UJ51 TaxID=2892446 RepID=UPI001E41B353|nr:GGDEF domain-containing protein [Rheinheimera sp. UJ51]MCC5450238.1 GGDEF domain-containing protein [Rheinheimera sp. UJ51]